MTSNFSWRLSSLLSFYLMSAIHKLCCTKLSSNKMRSQIYCWFVSHILHSSLLVEHSVSSPANINSSIYIYLVFTKSVNSNFRAFWLAPVTWNILGYSLFCERREKWRVVSRKFFYFFIKTAFSYPSDLVNTKTTIPSGSVKSGGYIPRRFASRYTSTPIHTGDSCTLFPIFGVSVETVQQAAYIFNVTC